jgi:hypothetical protein
MKKHLNPVGYFMQKSNELLRKNNLTPDDLDSEFYYKMHILSERYFKKHIIKTYVAAMEDIYGPELKLQKQYKKIAERYYKDNFKSFEKLYKLNKHPK